MHEHTCLIKAYWPKHRNILTSTLLNLILNLLFSSLNINFKTTVIYHTNRYATWSPLTTGCNPQYELNTTIALFCWPMKMSYHYQMNCHPLWILYFLSVTLLQYLWRTMDPWRKKDVGFLEVQGELFNFKHTHNTHTHTHAHTHTHTHTCTRTHTYTHT